MELASNDEQEQDFSISCPQYMLAQVIEIPPRTVLLELMEAIGAEQSSIFTSIPCESLRFKANEQVIEIPPRIVLLKVLEAIGAKVAPIFTCTPCESLRFKVSVELDVPASRFSVRKPPPVAKVEGEICDSPGLAETSAVMNALKYLGQKHSIQVLDYSSSIIKMFALGYEWRDFHDLDNLINKMIEQWDFSLKKFNRLSDHLDYKVIMDYNDHDLINEAGKVYTTLDDFIIYIIKRYSSMPIYARSELEKIHEEHHKYSEYSTKKHKFVRKVRYLQTIWFSEKDVLDYVLSYLGMGKAEYNSVPSCGGKVEGEVKFSFPCMVEGRFHKMEVHSQALASSGAEEVAARAALQFMESKLNVKIVDLNYSDRQIAKHKFLESIKDRYLEVVLQMKLQLGNMVEFIAGGCAAYNGDPRLMFGGPLSQEAMMAVEFCSKSLDALRGDCATRYESCVSMFEEMEKKLEVIKTELIMVSDGCT